MIDEEEQSEATPSPDLPEPPEDAVGYKRPPKHTRFAPGRSGNPKGRPRGRRSQKQLLEEIASECHSVREGDRVTEYSTFELVVLSLLKKSLEGHVRAFRAINRLHQRYGYPELSGAGVLLVPERMTPEEWQVVLERNIVKQQKLIADYNAKEAAEAEQRSKS